MKYIVLFLFVVFYLPCSVLGETASSQPLMEVKVKLVEVEFISTVRYSKRFVFKLEEEPTVYDSSHESLKLFRKLQIKSNRMTLVIYSESDMDKQNKSSLERLDSFFGFKGRIKKGSGLLNIEYTKPVQMVMYSLGDSVYGFKYVLRKSNDEFVTFIN